MAAGQQIALEPALALMLAEHGVQYAALWRQKLIIVDFAAVPLAIGDLKDIAKQVRKRLVRTENAEVPLVLVEARDIAKEFAEHQRVLCADRAGRRDGHRVVAKVRHLQIAQKNSAVGMRVGAHTARALRRKFGELGLQRSVGVEELFRLVALHPAFQELDMVGMRGVNEQGNLMRPKRAFNLQAVDDLRPAGGMAATRRRRLSCALDRQALRHVLDYESGDGGSDRAGRNSGANDPLDDGRSGLGDFRLKLDDIGLGRDSFGKGLAKGVGRAPRLLLGEAGGFQAVHISETVEENLGGHLRAILSGSRYGAYRAAGKGEERGRRGNRRLRGGVRRFGHAFEAALDLVDDEGAMTRLRPAPTHADQTLALTDPFGKSFGCRAHRAVAFKVGFVFGAEAFDDVAAGGGVVGVMENETIAEDAVFAVDVDGGFPGAGLAGRAGALVSEADGASFLHRCVPS